MSISVFNPFLDWVLCFLILNCISCLYILVFNPLSFVSFSNTFSYSEGCLFILFIVSFAVQTLLSLIRSHLFIFCFYFHYSRRWVKKIFAVIYVKEYSSHVESRKMVQMNLFADRNRHTDVENRHVDTTEVVGWVGRLELTPGSSVHGILQVRILEWAAISFSRESSWPRGRTQVSRIASRRFNLWATREAHTYTAMCKRDN